MTKPADIPAVIQLADEQLRCYNRADLDGFCACYAEDVVVLDADGKPTLQGIAEFRQRYGKLFETMRDVRAAIRGRLQMANHIVEFEAWRRTDPATGEEQAGEVIVRYTERGGKIAVVEFLH